MGLAHKSGCDERHTHRQQCNGPAADTRRAEQASALVTADPAHPAVEPQEWPKWLVRASVPLRLRLIGACLELLPGVAIAIIWLGSLRSSVQYDDFGILQGIALLPSVGWLWRPLIGCGTAGVSWFGRVMLITFAAFMWLGANDLGQLLLSNDRPIGNHENHCCQAAYQLGMHSALALAVALSALSAYAVGWWRRDDDGLGW